MIPIIKKGGEKMMVYIKKNPVSELLRMTLNNRCLNTALKND